MHINRSRKFQIKLLEILKFIAKDKISASRKFQNDLDKQINNIPLFPFKYKQSMYFNNKNIRDMTFKRYTIIYEINVKENKIEIMDIFNKNKPNGYNKSLDDE